MSTALVVLALLAADPRAIDGVPLPEDSASNQCREAPDPGDPADDVCSAEVSQDGTFVVGPRVSFAVAPSAVPDDATLEAAGAVIGTITIHAGEIFDPEAPGEDHLPFRAANKLHITTRERVIRRQLTFAPGDRYDHLALEESERHLRHNGYLYDATIRPVRYDGRAVDIVVRTRDVWTLRPGLGFKRTGGVNTFHFGLHDANFLGLGKSLEVERVNGVDRTQTIFSLIDPAVWGTHARVIAAYSNNSDGQGAVVGVERPFWKVDASWGAGARAEQADRVDPLYALGEITSQYRFRHDLIDTWMGRKIGHDGPTTFRLLAGYTFDRSQFDAVPGKTTVLPVDRTLSYPWVGLAIVREAYVKTHDADKLGRTEDFDLGRTVELHLGWSAPALGADRSAAILTMTGQTGLNPGPGQMLIFHGGLAGRIAGSGVEDGRIDASAHYYHREGERRLFFAALTGAASSNADLDHQLLLGGDNGLRGYPLRYATGDKSLLLTIEERFYLQREFFHLIRIGAAIFADVGKAWSEDPALSNHLGVLRDLGFGLRFGQTRSAHASVLRVDFAMPFDSLDGKRHPQVVVTTGETF